MGMTAVLVIVMFTPTAAAPVLLTLDRGRRWTRRVGLGVPHPRVDLRVALRYTAPGGPMGKIFPWLLGLAALAMMFGGWMMLDRDIDQRAAALSERYEHMSEEEVLEDVVHRANRFNAGMGGEDVSDEIDGMLADADDPAIAARASRRLAERRRTEQAAAEAEANAATATMDVFLWVLLVGLAGVIIGGVVGAVLMLRKPREDEPGPPNLA
jgi:hypothetical protein